MLVGKFELILLGTNLWSEKYRGQKKCLSEKIIVGKFVDWKKIWSKKFLV